MKTSKIVIKTIFLVIIGVIYGVMASTIFVTIKNNLAVGMLEVNDINFYQRIWFDRFLQFAPWVFLLLIIVMFIPEIKVLINKLKGDKDEEDKIEEA